MEVWIWIIIMIVVAVAKSLGKLQPDESDSAEAPRPRPRPRPRPQRKPPASAMPSSPPPVIPPAGQRPPWSAPLDDLQDFLKRVERTMNPPPLVQQVPVATEVPVKPVAPPPVVPAELPRHVTPPATVAQTATRARQWTEALRDRQNLRNTILAAEIIGPPKALRVSDGF